MFRLKKPILLKTVNVLYRSSQPEVFFGKGVLKICSKFLGEHPCRSAILIKLQIVPWLSCSPVNLLHIFRTLFCKRISGRLLPKIWVPIDLFIINHYCTLNIFYTTKNMFKTSDRLLFRLLSYFSNKKVLFFLYGRQSAAAF